MGKIMALIIDMEGVLVKGSDLVPIPNATSFIDEINTMGIPYKIATNNSTLMVEEIHQKLKGNGFNLGKEAIVSPISICLSEFTSREIKNVMVLGSQSLKNILKKNGFQTVNDKSAQAILVGKMESLDLELLKNACEVLQEGKSILCGINNNRLVMDDDSRPYPGPGAIIHMLQFAVDYREPIIHFGKGSEKYDNILIKELGHNWTDVMMISDDPYTDLEHYQSKGCIGVFVTTGKYKRSHLKHIQPHMSVDDVMEILKAMRSL
jgi:4-nitrophenyl phosphatase